ncbi:MAG TPA: peptide-methionine (S)-S-oxide reductase, partial [Gammaproteobacteria bacterium]|nr:peptide-methionine (S)-S-oxide reductase [Gammaproteobacteria bacterium]
DRGSSYRTAIFVEGEKEEALAQASKQAIQNQLDNYVMTLILPLSKFYEAESYHQDYYVKNPIRYKYYRFRCGRDDRLEELWDESSN